MSRLQILILTGLISWLAVNATEAAVSVTRGPYLQNAQPKGMTIRWRTSEPTNSRVWYSMSPTDLNLVQDDPSSTTEHSITLTGLNSNTKYFYKVGSTSEALKGPYHFFTPPDDGHPDALRIWAIGDAGFGGAGAEAVRDAYYNFVGDSYTNAVFSLGNGAYSSGTDNEWQWKFFGMFSTILRETPVYPALGEVDTAGSSSPPATLPYYQAFDLPQNGEAGGVPSGTEDYYSFNIGTLHVVVLDSMTEDRSINGPMLTWLQSDLTANGRPWIIAYWHHAPHSKGNHDSDAEAQMIQMRQNANQILEAFGVDLVLSAHSNSYERSFLIDGSYGPSTTFNQSHIKNGGSGNPQTTGAYVKPAGTPHSGTVYAVLGSSSFTGGGPLNHPAMYVSLNTLGSMLIDLNCAAMRVRFVTTSGVADEFQINKADIPPATAITGPLHGSVFPANSDITLTASASDPDTRIKQVRFFQNGVAILRDSTEPYSILWSDVSPGSYSLTAVATDQLCVAGTSAPVNIAVCSTPDTSCNAPPIAADDSYTLTVNTGLNVPVPGVLANDTDVEGSALTAALVSGPSHGTVTLNPNGSFLYAPTANFVGDDSFTYRVSDGTSNSNVGSVNLAITAPTCLFCDDFNDGNFLAVPGPWKTAGVWSALSGNAVGIASKKATLESPAYAPCSTCQVIADVSIDAGNGKVSIYGWWNGNPRDAVEVKMLRDRNKVVFKRRVGGNAAFKVSSPFPIELGRAYKVKIIFDGAFHLFIDGAPIISNVPPGGPPPSGTFAFRIKGVDGRATKATLHQVQIFP